MSYKPDESTLMAYLYGEVTGEEKERIELYLAAHADARLDLERLQNMRSILANVHDKEVIAPPLFLGDSQRTSFWQTPYIKTVMSVAASLIMIMLVAKVIGLRANFSENEVRIGFGAEVPKTKTESTPVLQPTLSPSAVQGMINTALHDNNELMERNWRETRAALNESITRNLVSNSSKIDALVKESASASQDQIRQFVSGLQDENLQLVKNYFQLTANDQKQYMEDLLIDFAKYLQQQRNNDLQVVQNQLTTMQQKTDMFKQETEEILTSIITTVERKNSQGTKY